MKAQLLFTFLVLFALKTNAQVEFEDNLVIDNSLYVQSSLGVFSADLDGDGDLDVLSSSYFADKLVWLENLDGVGGDFALQIISTTIQNPWGVHAADLDADGDMDVLAASLTGDHIIWYENTDGNGTFLQKQFISAFEVNLVRTGDMDGDGDLDIIWSSAQDGKIKYSRNTDGLGTFAGALNIENNVSIIPDFHTIDVDADGDLDVVSAWSIQGGSQGVSWYRNENGAGSFSSRITISNAVNGVPSVYAGDLDGDGDMDVAAALSGDDKIVWYENTDGLGTFGTEQVLSANADVASRVRIADVDGDGDLDVIATSNDDDKITWFENFDGAGNFGTEILIDSYLGNMRSLHISDLDGDGDMDFLTATDQGNNIKWYNNLDGLGNYSAYVITKHLGGGKAIFAEDLDGDGDKDILSASNWDDKIAWYENKDGQGDFHNTQRIISETLNGTGSVFAEDLNGDGDKDVIATSPGDNDIVWFQNTDGLGNFGEPQIIDDDFYSANKVYTSDIDNDGDMDVFCLARGKVVWYKNMDGLGNFGTRQEIESVNNFFMWSLDFGDLDGDGDLDISVASSYRLLYFLNLDGQGNFGPRQEIEDFYYDAVSTKIADIDGDGDNDIVYTGDNTDSDYVGWSENLDGLATFGDIQLITTIISNPKSIIVADFDNDGDIDIASSAQGDGGVIAWYENSDGLGDFSTTQQIVSLSSNSPLDIFATDIDNNNTMDIVSISNFDNRILWIDNKGTTLANEISGTVRFDLLGDGCTEADELLSGILLFATSETTSNATFTQENGEFSIFTTEEGIINTQMTSQLPTYYQTSPANFQSDFIGFGNVDTIDFCIEPIAAINDLNVSIYPSINIPRPGFDTTYRIVYNNLGTTQLNGSVSFEFDDSKINFLNASETATSETSNILTFDFSDLNPFETRTIDLEFNVFAPPTTNIDDELVATASINPVSGDVTEEDNVFTLEQIVIGSYDPNDITVLEGEDIFIEDAGKYLHYLIRFQNTGTASAINVRVEHVLDDELDWTSMQLESLSHTGRVEITNETDVSFIFNNINLPDSTNDEPNSHGYIAFKIKPKADVEVGDVFSGVAAIYFDFNPPIITNTVTTTIVEPLNVEEFNPESINLFPNPAKDNLEITSNQIITNLMLIDINGRVLKSIAISKRDYNLDISSLSKGVYFLEVESGVSKSTKKFIKN